MTTMNQGLSFMKIEQIVAQRLANAIKTIAIYETRTRVARDLVNQVVHQEDKVAENANNKRKWEGDHGGNSSQKQIKRHEEIRAHIVGLSDKKGYAGKLPHCNKCKFHHTGRCTTKCGKCKWIGRLTKSCSFFVRATTLRPTVASQNQSYLLRVSNTRTL
ncbi:hypothetical protein Tco_0629223 [Tanacetum coccineum]|uniref:Reverse transcriptase domain-containing protein n=1 Tax=Tanacetum coccineum TaxID=301880 RepID=A0ABQ4WT80_9ASTR